MDGPLDRPRSADPRRSPPRPPRWLTAGRIGAALALVVGLGSGLLGSGCVGRGDIRSELERASLGDEDVVALLPRGLEAVLDVDVAGLRQLDTAAEILSYLPERALRSLEVACDLPLRNVDALAVGLGSLGTSQLDSVVVLRGNLERTRVFAGVRKFGQTREVEYHGLPLIETEHGYAAAMLTGRTTVLGNRITVRQVIDIFRGEEEGLRRQKDLMAALDKAPRAKEGRPALRLALLMTAPLRERLRQVGLPEFGADADYLAASVAVGDGIDIGVVGGYAQLSAAQDVAHGLIARTQSLRQRPALMFIGIDRYLSSFQAVAVPPAPSRGRAGPELHLMYRLPGDDLAEFLSRIEKLRKLRSRLRGEGS